MVLSYKPNLWSNFKSRFGHYVFFHEENILSSFVSVEQ